MIEIRWRAADLPTSTSPSVNGSTPINYSPNTQPVFGTGAVAGIGVGAAVGALILLGTVIWFWRRSRKSKGDGLESKTEYEAIAENGRYFEHDQPQQHTVHGELDASPKRPVELHSNARYELPARPAELGQ